MSINWYLFSVKNMRIVQLLFAETTKQFVTINNYVFITYAQKEVLIITFLRSVNQIIVHNSSDCL